MIEQFDTTSTCLTLNITESSPARMNVVKARQNLILNTLTIENHNTYSATLDIPDEANEGKMRVKWALSKFENNLMTLD